MVRNRASSVRCIATRPGLGVTDVVFARQCGGADQAGARPARGCGGGLLQAARRPPQHFGLLRRDRRSRTGPAVRQQAEIVDKHQPGTRCAPMHLGGDAVEALREPRPRLLGRGLYLAPGRGVHQAADIIHVVATDRDRHQRRVGRERVQLRRQLVPGTQDVRRGGARAGDVDQRQPAHAGELVRVIVRRSAAAGSGGGDRLGDTGAGGKGTAHRDIASVRAQRRAGWRMRAPGECR